MVHVAVEVGKKKSFASALEWPGWSRSGKDEDAAIKALLDYAERYRVVTDRAGIAFRPGSVDVVERLAGSATTDFGAPDAIAEREHDTLAESEAERLASLRRGRHGTCSTRSSPGRRPSSARAPEGAVADRDKMVVHVVEAEQSYARKLGLDKPKQRHDLRGRHRRRDQATADGYGVAGALRRPPDRLARPRSRLGDRGSQRVTIRRASRPRTLL